MMTDPVPDPVPLLPSTPPVRMQLPAGARTVAAGDTHTCVLFPGGAVRCWGENADGQLGLGHRLDLGDDADEWPPPPASLYPSLGAPKP